MKLFIKEILFSFTFLLIGCVEENDVFYPIDNQLEERPASIHIPEFLTDCELYDLKSHSEINSIYLCDNGEFEKPWFVFSRDGSYSNVEDLDLSQFAPPR